MTTNHYAEFIEEAFIEPIRSVLIVDDDYPTYEDILATATPTKRKGRRTGKKRWLYQAEQVSRLIKSFRQRNQPLLVDIHDGANLPKNSKKAVAGHLHQSDLLVLDYELDRSRPNDGTRAVNILRRLMSNNHFNLVIIHTRAELDIVFETLRWELVTPRESSLSEGEVRDAEALIDCGEDEIEHFSDDLNDSIGSAHYFDARQNPDDFLDTMMSTRKALYAAYRSLANNVCWSPEDRKLVVRYLLWKLETTKLITKPNRRRFDNLEWSTGEVMWIKSDSAFVALTKKSTNTDDLLSDLKNALVDWNPRPSRLFLNKLRAEIDEHGIAAQGDALRNHHALAYWYSLLLKCSDSNERHWRISESVSRQCSELLNSIYPKVERYASELVHEEIVSGSPDDICRTRFGVDLNDEAQEVRAVLQHNALVCSMRPVGPHLTTGHVFLMDDEYWVCLSPACDMVHSQMPAWRQEVVGNCLPFVGVHLYNDVSCDKVYDDTTSNRYIYIEKDKSLLGFCFNDPSSAQSRPRWETLFADNKGNLRGKTLQFRAFRISQGKTRLVSKSSRAQVVGQLRYEYALNLVQKLSVSLTRVGLDFAGKVKDAP